jgi:hypothetical protein
MLKQLLEVNIESGIKILLDIFYRYPYFFTLEKTSYKIQASLI